MIAQVRKYLFKALIFYFLKQFSSRSAVSPVKKRKFSGDSLALRGFRRYLITQVEACVKAEPSVYQEDVNNRFKVSNQLIQPT